MATYSLVFNVGTADEIIERNEMTLEQAFEQCEEIKSANPSENVEPLENA